MTKCIARHKIPNILTYAIRYTHMLQYNMYMYMYMYNMYMYSCTC